MDREAIAEVFDRCFAESPHPLDRARMVRGGDEPLFLPASRFRPIAEVVYARGLAASCLHEAAHWLRAGRARRCLVDYGYWYLPDGRDADAQAEFERREAEVQGLEWILAASAGVPFRVSCDNLERPDPGLDFCAAIAAVAERRIAAGLPARAARLAHALAAASGRGVPSAAPPAQSLS